MKYPIYNKKAYFLLSAADAFLSIFLKRRAKLIPRPKKLLLCNCAHLGDGILTTALLAPLKKSFPDLRIGVLAASSSAPIFKNHPLVDYYHAIDHWKMNRHGKSKYFSYIKSRHQALKEIKRVGYDTAIDCNFHFPNMAPLLWQAKISIRIGFETAGLSPFLTHSKNWSPLKNEPAAYSFFSLFDFLPGIKGPLELKPYLFHQKSEKQHYIVIHPGSGDAKKQWPLQNWRQLTKKLVNDGYRLYFTGKGKKESELIQSCIEGLGDIKNLSDQLNFKELVEVIQKASLLIGVDSSAGHIASAVDTPSILLFTAIHPSNIWKPQTNLVRCLSKAPPCSPCFTGCHNRKCIEDISVEEVYHNVKSIKPLPTLPAESSFTSSLI